VIVPRPITVPCHLAAALCAKRKGRSTVATCVVGPGTPNIFIQKPSRKEPTMVIENHATLQTVDVSGPLFGLRDQVCRPPSVIVGRVTGAVAVSRVEHGSAEGPSIQCFGPLLAIGGPAGRNGHERPLESAGLRFLVVGSLQGATPYPRRRKAWWPHS
jgi:hypothetical protein